jgi:hypothetical protein
MLFAIWLICLFISLLLLLIGSTLCCEVDLGFCESCARSLDFGRVFCWAFFDLVLDAIFDDFVERVWRCLSFELLIENDFSSPRSDVF